jgi:hypothetical protein
MSDLDTEDICGHIHYDDSSPADLRLSAEATKTRKRRYWIGPGKFSDISREDTVQRIERAFQWAENFSNTQFIQVQRERDALHRIYFASAATIGQIVGDGKSYYAVQWPTHCWHFNRDLKVAHRRKYSVEAVNLHEFGHALRFKHSFGEKDLMHANVKGWYPTPQEIISFQKRLGKSSEFYPVPQQEVGKEIRDKTELREGLIREREILQLERQSSNNLERRRAITEIIRTSLTPEIQSLNQQISLLSAQWQSIANEYKIVPGSKS